MTGDHRRYWELTGNSDLLERLWPTETRMGGRRSVVQKTRERSLHRIYRGARGTSRVADQSLPAVLLPKEVPQVLVEGVEEVVSEVVSEECLKPFLPVRPLLPVQTLSRVERGWVSSGRELSTRSVRCLSFLPGVGHVPGDPPNYPDTIDYVLLFSLTTNLISRPWSTLPRGYRPSFRTQNSPTPITPRYLTSSPSVSV